MIRVNDYEISREEYALACENYTMQTRKRELDEKEKMAIANQLINAHLLLVESYNSDLEVTDYEVANNFDQLKAGYPSDDDFQKALQRVGDSEESIRRKLKDDLQLRKFIAQEFYSKAVVSPEEQEQFYKEHEESFITPLQVKASHILVSTEEKAKAIKKEIEEGKSFEDMARKHSSCPSAQNGGDLGDFGKGQMVQEFESVAFALEPGKISGPVQTQFGFHLIVVKEKHEERKQSFEEAQKAIASHMQGAIANDLMSRTLKELRAGASISIDKDQL